MRKFSLVPRDLSVQALDLLLKLSDVGCGEGRVQCCKQPALLDDLALTNVDGLDDGRVERLQHKRRVD